MSKRNWLAIGLALVGAAVFGIALAIWLHADAAKERTVAAAEADYAEATRAVARARGRIESIDWKSRGVGEDSHDAAADAKRDLQTAKDELTQAQRNASALDTAEPGRDLYLTALESAGESVDDLEAVASNAEVLGDLQQQFVDANDEFWRAKDLYDAAIRAGNIDDFRTMRTKASEAVMRYRYAKEAFAQGHDLAEAACLDREARFCELRAQQAEVAVGMADDGGAKRLDEYNEGIRKLDAYAKRIKAARLSELTNDSGWCGSRLEREIDAALVHAQESARRRHLALERFGLDP